MRPYRRCSIAPYLYVLLAAQVIPLGPLIMAPRYPGSCASALIRRQSPGIASGLYSLLPYVSIAATWPASSPCSPKAEHPRVGGILIGVVVITALVVTRQLAAFTDNAELLTPLDDQERLPRSLVRTPQTSRSSAEWPDHYASPALDRVIGIPPTTPSAHPASRLVHPDDVARPGSPCSPNSGDTTRQCHLLARVQHADGSWRWLQSSAPTCSMTPPSTASSATPATSVAREQQNFSRHQALHDPLHPTPQPGAIHRTNPGRRRCRRPAPTDGDPASSTSMTSKIVNGTLDTTSATLCSSRLDRPVAAASARRHRRQTRRRRIRDPPPHATEHGSTSLTERVLQRLTARPHKRRRTPVGRPGAASNWPGHLRRPGRLCSAPPTSPCTPRNRRQAPTLTLTKSNCRPEERTRGDNYVPLFSFGTGCGRQPSRTGG